MFYIVSYGIGAVSFAVYESFLNDVFSGIKKKKDPEQKGIK